MSTGPELRDLWDFDDPAGSEERFRVAAGADTDAVQRELALTQVARALGLQDRFSKGHEVLDAPRSGSTDAVHLLISSWCSALLP